MVTFAFIAFNSARSSADFEADAAVRVVEEGEVVDDLPVVEAIEDVLRTGVVDGVPVTRVGRVVEAVGEVTFRVPFMELVVERTEGTVLFRVKEGDAVVDPAEEATEALLVTPGVAVARVFKVLALVGAVVAPLSVEGVLDARTELAVGLVAVRDVSEVGDTFAALAVRVRGVLEGLVVAAVGTAGFLLPAVVSPAAAKDDMRLLTLGGLSVMT
jgi:hypothetical protein